jgi:predicted CopG family antitoxin
MKTMKIDEEVHKRLKKYARKDETFSDVINRLLDAVGA